MSGKPIDEARQIIEEFIQCAEVGRPHGKLIAQARDWLALTAAQQQGQTVGVEAKHIEALRSVRDVGVLYAEEQEAIDAIIAALTQQPAAVDGKCPKCNRQSGDNWKQCEGACPMPQSPHHKETKQ